MTSAVAEISDMKRSANEFASVDQSHVSSEEIRNYITGIGQWVDEYVDPKRGFEPYMITFMFWPAPGSEDTELGVLMEPEVDHGEAEVYTRVQA
jgi:hypothetical protein